jgi:hypothetical protein
VGQGRAVLERSTSRHHPADAAHEQQQAEEDDGTSPLIPLLQTLQVSHRPAFDGVHWGFSGTLERLSPLTAPCAHPRSVPSLAEQPVTRHKQGGRRSCCSDKRCRYGHARPKVHSVCQRRRASVV